LPALDFSNILYVRQGLKKRLRRSWGNPNANSGVNVTDSTVRLWIVVFNSPHDWNG
jgi:hypothetical protein